MAEPIRVLIAFKEEDRRSRAKSALGSERDLWVAGEAATGGEAAELAAIHHPHLVLLDAGIEAPSSVETCRTIRSADLTKVIGILFIVVGVIAVTVTVAQAGTAALPSGAQDTFISVLNRLFG